MRLRLRLRLRLRGWCEAARLRGCEAARLGARLRGCKAARLQGCEAARLRGCEAARLRGCEAEAEAEALRQLSWQPFAQCTAQRRRREVGGSRQQAAGRAGQAGRGYAKSRTSSLLL